MKTITSADAPAAIGPYAQAVRSGDLLFVSGQLGLDPRTGDFASVEVAGQTRQALANLAAIALDAGADLAHVLKTTVFLTTMDHFAAMNEQYARAFGEHRPARSTIAVAGLPRGGLVEIEAVVEAPGR